jgi:tripeptide aminopeptidase
MQPTDTILVDSGEPHAKRSALLALMLTLLVCSAGAQESWFSASLAQRPEVQRAFAFIDGNQENQLAEWIRITEIPAPSRSEGRRADYIESELKKIGLDAVVRDKAGNVIGRLNGSGSGPNLVFAAHMDTVHPIDTPIKVRREGNTLFAPGVFDNSSSCSNLLQAARALKSAQARLKGNVAFVFTVQEEIGFDGMRAYLEDHRGKVDLLVAIDGALGSVSYGALGIYWTRFVYTGEGAHTNNSRGKPNPSRAVARAILAVSQVPVPGPESESAAIVNIGMIGGGKIVNAISQESFFTVDLRTTDPVVLKDLDEKIAQAAERAATEEKVGFRREVISQSAAGGTSAQLADRRRHPIVQTGLDVLEYLLKKDYPNFRIAALPSGSTDGNVGVELGIPTIAVGRTFGKDQHTLQESAEIKPLYLGAKQLVLLAFALADH